MTTPYRSPTSRDQEPDQDRERLVVLTTSPRVPAGLFSGQAWERLRRGLVVTPDTTSPQRAALLAAGVAVGSLLAAETSAASEEAAASVEAAASEEAAASVQELTDAVRERAQEADAEGRPLVIVVGESSLDVALVAALVQGAGELPAEVIAASFDLPGARLLDAVAVMDRLRSPGGCPWDAEQTHQTLAPYLLEEAYEAYQTIEDQQPDQLRDELGDVLLQVLFHARIASERTEGWDVDAVASGLVDKLVRRHPHVFADTTVSGAAEVETNWDALKLAEGRTSVTDGVALGQPALSLAAKLLKRAGRASFPVDYPGIAVADSPEQAVAGLAAAVAEHGDLPVERVGEMLFAVVAVAQRAGVDPEAALRATARRFRDHLTEQERPAAES